MIEIKKTTDANYESHSRAFVHPTAAKYSVLKDNEVVAYIMSSDSTKIAFTKVEWVLTDAKTYRPIKYFSPMRTKSVPAFEKAKAYAREYYS